MVAWVSRRVAGALSLGAGDSDKKLGYHPAQLFDPASVGMGPASGPCTVGPGQGPASGGKLERLLVIHFGA